MVACVLMRGGKHAVAHPQPRALGWTARLPVTAVHQADFQDLCADQPGCEPRWGYAHLIPSCVQMRTTLVFVHQHEYWHLAGLHFCNIGQPLPFARSS